MLAVHTKVSFGSYCFIIASTLIYGHLLIARLEWCLRVLIKLANVTALQVGFDQENFYYFISIYHLFGFHNCTYRCSP